MDFTIAAPILILALVALAILRRFQRLRLRAQNQRLTSSAGVSFRELSNAQLSEILDNGDVNARYHARQEVLRRLASSDDKENRTLDSSS